MKLTLYANPFEIGDCRVIAKFIGVDPYFNPDARDNSGRSIGQQLRWRFSIGAGPDIGKIASTLTPAVAGVKNWCGKMLEAISDGLADIGTEIDLNQFVGGWYRITIENGFVSIKVPPMYCGKQKPDTDQYEEMTDPSSSIPATGASDAVSDEIDRF